VEILFDCVLSFFKVSFRAKNLSLTSKNPSLSFIRISKVEPKILFKFSVSYKMMRCVNMHV